MKEKEIKTIERPQPGALSLPPTLTPHEEIILHFDEDQIASLQNYIE